jgi:hypothetical protein
MKKTYISTLWGVKRSRFFRFVGCKKAIMLVAPFRRRQMEKKLDAREAAVA